MNNIYLIYGSENYLIKKELSKIIDNSNINEDSIIKYNLDEVNVSSVLEEASMVGLFSNEKLIICENSNFLTGEFKKNIEHDIDSLEKYIEKPYEDVKIIFIVNKEKLDERKKIVKTLKKHSKVIECKKVESHDLNNYIYNYFKENGYNIEMNLVRLIIDKVKYDLSNIINECDKLMNYKIKIKI